MSSFSWNDASVRSALGLRVDLAQSGVEYVGVSTDSRSVAEGDLYVALEGERFDGHDFVLEAVARGASGAVVSRPVSVAGAALYPVPDTLVALGALATYRRHALSAPVVGITGSVGKTTTKDLARGALSGALNVHATRANLNNRIGVPLTLLAVPPNAEVVVLEMGSNEPGEIAALAAIARPDVGVVTTVGEGHLEKLGSVEGVLHEKLDLLRGLAAGGRCVVGDEPDFFVEEARRVCPELRVAGWSERSDVDLRPEEVVVDHWGVHRFRWRGQSVTLGLPGRHAVANALLALAVSELLGVSPRVAVEGLVAVEAEGMRGEVRRIGGLSVVVDCYNANPLSVRAALDLLESHVASRRVVVLGSMLELGRSEESLHRSVLEDALARDIDLVVATGIFAKVGSGRESTFEGRLLLADDWGAAYPALRERLSGDEVVLLKASRGVALEGIIPLIEADFGGSRDSVEVGEEG